MLAVVYFDMYQLQFLLYLQSISYPFHWAQAFNKAYFINLNLQSMQSQNAHNQLINKQIKQKTNCNVTFDQKEEIMHTNKNPYNPQERGQPLTRDAFIRLAVLETRILKREKQEKIYDDVQNIVRWKLEETKKWCFVQRVVAFAERIRPSLVLARCLEKIVTLLSSMDERCSFMVTFLIVENGKYMKLDYVLRVMDSTLLNLDIKCVKTEQKFVQLCIEYCKISPNLKDFKNVLNFCVKNLETDLDLKINEFQDGQGLKQVTWRIKNQLLRFYVIGAVKSQQQNEKKAFENKLRKALENFRSEFNIKTLIKQIINRQQNQRWGLRLRKITNLQQNQPSLYEKWQNNPKITPIQFKIRQKQRTPSLQECALTRNLSKKASKTQHIAQLKQNQQSHKSQHPSIHTSPYNFNIKTKKNISELHRRGVSQIQRLFNWKQNKNLQSLFSTKPSVKSEESSMLFQISQGSKGSKVGYGENCGHQIQEKYELEEEELQRSDNEEKIAQYTIDLIVKCVQNIAQSILDNLTKQNLSQMPIQTQIKFQNYNIQYFTEILVQQQFTYLIYQLLLSTQTQNHNILQKLSRPQISPRLTNNQTKVPQNQYQSQIESLCLKSNNYQEQFQSSQQQYSQQDEEKEKDTSFSNCVQMKINISLAESKQSSVDELLQLCFQGNKQNRIQQSRSSLTYLPSTNLIPIKSFNFHQTIINYFLAKEPKPSILGYVKKNNAKIFTIPILQNQSLKTIISSISNKQQYFQYQNTLLLQNLWILICQKYVQINLSRNGITKMKVTLYQYHKNQQKYDAMIYIEHQLTTKQYKFGKKADSLKQVHLKKQDKTKKIKNNEMKYKNINKMRFTGLGLEMRDKLRDSLQIIVGANIRVNLQGKIEVEGCPGLEQLMVLLQ